MKLETQYLWREQWGKKWQTGITWHADTPEWRRPGIEPVLESARQVMVRDQPCEWDEMYARTSTNMQSRPPRPQCQLRMPPCCSEDQGICPLPAPASAYSVQQDGETWIVVQAGKDFVREIYRGPGPVFVEPANGTAG